MLNLLVDIGNTSIKIAVASDENICDELRSDIDSFITDVGVYKDKYNGFDIVAVSDVRGVSEDLYLYLSSICTKLVKVGSDINLPINIKYNTPHTLGADRICAAVGARMAFPAKNCAVVDFGTAITIDFITSDGDFLGGNISLGLSTRFKALNTFTGKLPLLEKCDSYPQIGKTTNDAIQAGIVLGTIFEIEGYIRAYPQFDFIFTGGDAIFFAEKLKSPIFVVYNLVLKGLAQIAITNAF